MTSYGPKLCSASLAIDERHAPPRSASHGVSGKTPLCYARTLCSTRTAQLSTHGLKLRPTGHCLGIGAAAVPMHECRRITEAVHRNMPAYHERGTFLSHSRQPVSVRPNHPPLAGSTLSSKSHKATGRWQAQSHSYIVTQNSIWKPCLDPTAQCLNRWLARIFQNQTGHATLPTRRHKQLQVPVCRRFMR